VTFLLRSRLGAEIHWPIFLLLPIAIVAALAMYRRSIMPGLLQQQEMQVLTHELQAMFDNTLVGIAHIRDRRYVTVNAECARIYGMTPELMIGAPISIIFRSVSDGESVVARVEKSLAEQGAAVYETDYRRPDGKLRHLLAQGHRFDRTDAAKGTIWVLIDITERKEAELALLASEDAYRRLVETVPSMIFSLDGEGRFSFANDVGVRLIAGVPASELLGREFVDFMPSSGAADSWSLFRRVLSGETVVRVETRIKRADSRDMVVSITAQPLRDPGGRIVGVSGTAVDVTERRGREFELQRTRDLLHSAVEAMPDGFALFDHHDRVAMCNARYADLHGASDHAAELIGKHITELLHLAAHRTEQMPPEFLGDEESWTRERLRRHRDANGQPYVYETSDERWIQVTKRRTPDGSVVGIYTDITQLKRSEEAVRILAQHDALTGLPNRRLMNDRLAQAIAQAKRNGEMAAVLLIDLDDFKPINDEHGHRAGDDVLRVVALRLKECVREVDTVARYGGDEFVVVLSSVNRPRDAGLVAEKIIGALAEPIPALWISQHGSRVPEVRVGCSIGISMFPQDATQPDALIRRADAAMYTAKSRGRGCLVFHAAPPSAQPSS
jgi:diguanylate cyclase (GGDEF)-like protein/PAS domain S-box-containing protein